MKKTNSILFSLLSLIVVMSMMVGCASQPAATEAPVVATEAPVVATEAPVVATEAPAEVGVEGCRISAPSEPTTVNIIGWSYPIIDFYFKELEKCGEVPSCRNSLILPMMF